VTRRFHVDPGALRHELVLEIQSGAADGLGGRDDAWMPVATVFARIEPVSAGQTFAGAQDIEATTHRITLRHRVGVESGMRFVKGARRFRIVTVRDPDETGRFLICQTEELP
jgi:SPP1 family predicted phage head-tail adaptor